MTKYSQTPDNRSAWEKAQPERESRIREYLETTQDDPFYTEDMKYLVELLDEERRTSRCRNCEGCGWPQIACCCEPITHPDNPVGIRRCGECGGDHEPSGSRTDCITHWKRRAIEAENKVNVAKHYGH